MGPLVRRRRSALVAFAEDRFANGIANEPPGTGRYRHHELGLSEEKKKPERTFGYMATRGGMRIVELENRCTG
jgi:hypothetical protein